MKNVISLFLLLLLPNAIIAQQPNDCANALTVCGNGTFYSNANGIGGLQEVNACSGLEHNSLWLEIHIVQAGTLGFNLIPNDPSITVDYDFWVYGPNAVCGSLGSPIRCATTNPQLAGLTSNVTGMIASSLLTNTGPGANGNGFVRWLNVLPGQSYYIAVDRPVGGGGFRIEWTGSANNGTGAFPIPPTVNSIPDVLTCSNTANVGIYNLDDLKSSINSDIIGNTITFHTSVEDANDGINPLPNIFSNTSNPQTIYARVTDNLTHCYTTTDFDLVVSAQFDYNTDGITMHTSFLNASGTFTFTEVLTSTTRYNLTAVRILDSSGNTICSQALTQSFSIVVNGLPIALISGTTTICGGGSAVITIRTVPLGIVTYNIDGNPNQTIATDATGIATITTPFLTANSTYNLVSVINGDALGCGQAQTGSATITVVTMPSVTISGSTTICSGSSTNINFTGTPNAVVIYKINGGTNQTIALNNLGSATLNTSALTINTTFTLVSVADSTLTCSQNQTGSAQVNISTTPTVVISGTTTICSGETTNIRFTGTPNATIEYTINGGLNQIIILDGTGNATLTTAQLTADTIFELVSASLTGTPICSQSQTGSAIITVNPLPFILQPLAPYRVCDSDIDGIAVFDLNNPVLASSIIASPQIPANYTITYYLTANGANPMTNIGELPLPNNYTNATANSQNIYIRVVSNSTGCVNHDGIITLAVEQFTTATPLPSPAFHECDNFDNLHDGIALVDLTTYASTILGTQDPGIFLISYYTSLTDAQAGINALTLEQSQAYQTDSDFDTIWAKVINSSNTIAPFCYAMTTIDIEIERYPNPVITTINNVSTICVDFNTKEVVRTLTLDSGITDIANHTFAWFEGTSTSSIPGETAPTLTVNTASISGDTRNYSVTVTNNSSLSCQKTSAPFPVIQSGQAVIPAGSTGYTVTNAFSDLQMITIIIDGYGAPDYEYSLDDGPRQTSTVFTNVTSGTHTVHVWDTKGGISSSCEELIIEGIKVIDYPHYFTPNGDGYNDTWNIDDLKDQTQARIYIFDRYGKLLKEIRPSQNGWDGIYNGHQLMSDDYWFTVDYLENNIMKQFKAHFAMKR
jgi:gliding motility-associated-like protein